jgi:hypothetical protein
VNDFGSTVEIRKKLGVSRYGVYQNPMQPNGSVEPSGERHAKRANQQQLVGIIGF